VGPGADRAPQAGPGGRGSELPAIRMSGTVTREAVRRKLMSLLTEIAGIPSDVITDSATVDNELQMKSVAFVELQVAIEDAYEIEIDPIQVLELNRFGAIVDYVFESAAAQAA